MFEEAFCVLRVRNKHFSFLIGCISRLMCRVGTGKVSFFLNFASSFMWWEKFCPGRPFYFDDFYFIEKP